MAELLSRESIKSAVLDAAKAAAVAAALAFPLLGFRLTDSVQGAGIEYRLPWIAYAALAVFLGRLAVNFIKDCHGPLSLPSGRAFARTRGRATQTIVGLFHRVDTRLLGGSVKRGHDKSGSMVEPLLLAVMIAFALALPFLPFAERNLLDRATLILIYVLLATGLNITVGLAGLLDLGYVAFYAVGAYSYALLTQDLGLSFWAAMPVTGLLAASFGLMLGFPVLRLRGDYLAIVTLGFGQIAHTILVNWTEVTGGPNGISGIARPSFFGLPFAPGADGGTTFAQFFGIEFSALQRIYFLYYLILAIVLVAGALVWRIRRLPLGRAFEALREDETACISLGLNPTAIKLSAFALGAGIAGIAGSLFATRQGFISPESFTFVETAIILSIVVLGGMGSQIGIVLAAILLVGLPEWFRELEDYRMLAFGLAMVLIMLWRPQGLTRSRRPTILLAAGAPQ
jgi:branched-chain amino acid transport system permease protein